MSLPVFLPGPAQTALLGLGLSLLIAALAYWRGSLTRSGAVGAVLTGTLIFSIGSGKMGPVTQKLQDAYFGIVRGKNVKYSDWLTPVYA